MRKKSNPKAVDGDSRGANPFSTEQYSPQKKRTNESTGFDVDELNEFYSLVMVSGRTIVLEENWKRRGRTATPQHEWLRYISVDGFKQWHANRTILIGDRRRSAGQLWLTHPGRRQYQGFTFDPSKSPGGGEPGGYYNLWQGYTVERNPNGSCSIFMDHIRTNVANGNEGHANFIIGTLADMFQNPTDRKGIALVLRGRMGTGKTVLGQHIGRLIEGNYVLVSSPRHIVGHFNTHLSGALFIQADEGFWAGDKAAEGVLKSLITSDTNQIEMKGKDPVQVKNYVHLLITSNSSWAVPAGLEERRFAVFDVGDHCMQDHEYFGNMAAELNDGGYGALLDLLLTFKTGSINLRQVPSTSALFEQKLSSLSTEYSWWLTCLQRGWVSAPDGHQVADTEPPPDHWPAETEKPRAFASYIAFCEQVGERYRKTPPLLGTELNRLVRNLRHGRVTVGDTRPHVYRFPPLEECRRDFEEMIGAMIDWETGELLPGPSIDDEGA